MRRSKAKPAGGIREARIDQVEEGRYQVRCGRKSLMGQKLSHQGGYIEDYKIRRIYDEDAESWWLSVVHIQVLTQQKDYQTARKYWNKLKERLKKEAVSR